MITKIGLLAVCIFGVINAGVTNNAQRKIDFFDAENFHKDEAFAEINTAVNLLMTLAQELPLDERQLSEEYWSILNELKNVTSTGQSLLNSNDKDSEDDNLELEELSEAVIFKKILKYVDHELNNNSPKIHKREANSHEHKEHKHDEEHHSKPKGKLDKIKSVLGKVKHTTGIMKGISKSGYTKKIFYKVCSKLGVNVEHIISDSHHEYEENAHNISDMPDKPNKSELENLPAFPDIPDLQNMSDAHDHNDHNTMTKSESKKSLKQKICSAKIFHKIQHVIQSTHKAVSVLTKVLSKDHIHKIKHWFHMFGSKH